jgi:mono/diheme cytochrome c family protein
MARIRHTVLLTLLLAPAHALPAGAESADIQAGREIAEQYCARCHAIGPDDESLHRDAPPLRTFGDQWPLESIEEALAEGIVVGHPDMPELAFDPDEIANLLGYIATLR